MNPEPLPPDRAAARAEVELHDKRVATAAARAALKACVFHVGSDANGRAEYVISRWCWSRTFASLDDVEAFVDQLPGAAP